VGKLSHFPRRISRLYVAPIGDYRKRLKTESIEENPREDL
jgi:hypothetical protein